MLEDLAPARAFIRTPTEEGLPFEMLNTLPTMDGGQESFFKPSGTLKKRIHLRRKKTDCMMDSVKYFLNRDNC